VEKVSFSYRGRQSSLSFGKPVEVGKEYEVDITERSRQGDSGIAKIKGFVIFVPDAKPGEHVKVKIVRVGRNFATAELV